MVTGETLHALATETGATIWSVPIGTPSAPVVARGGWVIAAGGGGVTALRAADGEKVWTKPIGAVSERAAIDGDALYLPLTEGHLLAVDLKTGNLLWDQGGRRRADRAAGLRQPGLPGVGLEALPVPAGADRRRGVALGDRHAHHRTGGR